jgi:hypothetical protein
MASKLPVYQGLDPAPSVIVIAAVILKVRILFNEYVTVAGIQGESCSCVHVFMCSCVHVFM